MTAWDPACVGSPLFRGRTPANAVNMASPYISGGNIGSTAHPGLIPPVIPAAPGGGSSSPTPVTYLPFQIFLNGSPGSYNITVYPGSVNSAVPQHMLTVFPYVDSSTVYVKIHATSGGGLSVTTLDLQIDGNPVLPTPAGANAPAATMEVLLGIVTNNAVSQVWVPGNMLMVATQVFLVDNTPPVAPGYPYSTRYYNWNVTHA